VPKKKRGRKREKDDEKGIEREKIKIKILRKTITNCNQHEPTFTQQHPENHPGSGPVLVEIVLLGNSIIISIIVTRSLSSPT